MVKRLSILICTLNDRVKHVPRVLLTPRDEVCYVVSFQYTDEMFLEMVPPELKEREDVTLLPFPSTGLSANRNNALRHCATPLALIADDDVTYSHEQLDRLIETFDSHPEVDVACFQVKTAEGTFFKRYAAEEFDYGEQPSGTYYSSLEIAFRLDPRLPVFDTRFGLGASYLSCGEEEVFLHQAHKLGLHIRYFPHVICTIPSTLTTGSRFFEDKRVRRSKGAVFYMLYNEVSAFLRIFKTALTLRLPDNYRGVAASLSPSALSLRWRCFRDMLDGYFYVMRHPLNESKADDIPLEFQPINIWRMP